MKTWLTWLYRLLTRPNKHLLVKNIHWIIGIICSTKTHWLCWLMLHRVGGSDWLFVSPTRPWLVRSSRSDTSCRFLNLVQPGFLPLICSQPSTGSLSAGLIKKLEFIFEQEEPVKFQCRSGINRTVNPSEETYFQVKQSSSQFCAEQDNELLIPPFVWIKTLIKWPKRWILLCV